MENFVISKSKYEKIAFIVCYCFYNFINLRYYIKEKFLIPITLILFIRPRLPSPHSSSSSSHSLRSFQLQFRLHSVQLESVLSSFPSSIPFDKVSHNQPSLIPFSLRSFQIGYTRGRFNFFYG